ncbi:NADH-quinone oxidoreductase subunit NuoK [bacterium]|nr:NADH-quinone oxidoreductase subunit NuoK [bacterium]
MFYNSLEPYLVLSAILFVLGLLAMFTKRNAISILMGVELVLNAACINFVAFSRFVENGISGQLVTIFIIILAASEAAVALAIILHLYRHINSINVDEATQLEG